MAAIHTDRVSIAARDFVEILSGVKATTDAEPARERLLGWDGQMDKGSVAATIYAVFRERLMRDLMTPILGPLTKEAFAGTPRGAVAHMARIKARLADLIRRGDRTLLPPGAEWPAMLARALSRAVAELTRDLGPDMSMWEWGRLHGTLPRHTLSASHPEMAALLDPPAVPMGGDGDTVMAASFIAGGGYGLTSTSVARYVFDLADWEQSQWVVPLGASGHPGSPHYADQVQAWAEGRLFPMRYGWERVRAEAETHQALEPA
jgi:penicillin amidase